MVLLFTLAVIFSTMISTAGVLFVILKMNPSLLSSNSHKSITDEQLRNDPRYEIAQNMFDDAKKLYKEATRLSSKAYDALAADVRKDANKTLENAKSLMNEIRSDAAKYSPQIEKKKESPYPTDPIMGYGINSGIEHINTKRY